MSDTIIMNDITYDENEKPCVLLVGNILDGIFIVGPFNGTNAATEHGQTYFKGQDWVISDLFPPEEV